MTERVLEVRGMTCGGCESAVARVLGALPGVLSVQADHVGGQVRLQTTDAQTPTAEAIAATISGAGFELVRPE